MERKRSFIQGIMAGIGLLVLIFDSAMALEGARSGIELCIKTVIPSLFPFFVLSIILTNAFSEWVPSAVLVLSTLLGIPKAAASVLIPSVFGGYPVGAKCVGDLFQRKQIDRYDAERMLAFCSNAGPSFLFGMVSGFFPDGKMVWLLWIIHIFSAALTAIVIPAQKMEKHTIRAKEKAAEISAILSAAKAMGLVCCWVILFRIILSFLNVWFLWMLPVWVQVLLMGILELTNGCCELLLITNVKLRFVLCACMLSFGGICVLLQTASVTKGLSLRYYVRGKLLQTAFSFLLSCTAIFEQGVFFAALIPILVLIFRKIQNRYSNPQKLPV